MSEEPVDGSGVPEPVREWLAGLAEEEGLSGEELLGRALSGDGGEAFATSGAEVDALEARTEELAASVAELDGELDRKIEDVRERVVQVKRESDAKAPRDHDHDELDRLDQRLRGLEGEVDDVGEGVGRLADRIEAVADRLDGGFANFEDVLEYIVETTDDLNAKIETLADATIDLRARDRRRAATAARRAAVEGILRTAQRGGVTEAKCGDCGGTVQLGLLAAPECPHCGTGFSDLEPRRGFFRSSVLHTGERPALEGEVAGDPPDLEGVVGADGIDPPSLGSHSTDTEPAPEDADESPEADVEGESQTPGGAADRELTAVTGIGSAYAERLRAAGVETVGELALADPAALAERADIAPRRLETLVDRARALVDAE